MEAVETDVRTYFYITPRGREFHQSDDSWFPYE